MGRTPVPKRQHWVPRFYLRYFKVPDANPRLEQVWIFHRKEGEPILTAIENIAVGKHLYSPKRRDGTRDPRLERKLADLESLLSRLWPKLASGFVNLASDGVRKGIALFLAVQFLRHPDRRDLVSDSRRRIVEFIRQQPADSDGAPDIDTLQVGSRVVKLDKKGWQSYADAGPEFDEQAWHTIVEKGAFRYAKMLLEKRWSMVFIDDPLFVTSDHPLFVANPDLSRHQLGGKNAVLMFPVSPTRVLCFDNIAAPGNLYYHLGNDQADLYNMLSWVNTEAFMISSRDVYDVLNGIGKLRREFEEETRSHGA
jgi:hypothetical protein